MQANTLTRRQKQVLLVYIPASIICALGFAVVLTGLRLQPVSNYTAGNCTLSFNFAAAHICRYEILGHGVVIPLPCGTMLPRMTFAQHCADILPCYYQTKDIYSTDIQIGEGDILFEEPSDARGYRFLVGTIMIIVSGIVLVMVCVFGIKGRQNVSLDNQDPFLELTTK